MSCTCKLNEVQFTRYTSHDMPMDGLMERCFITGDQCAHRQRIISDKIKRHNPDGNGKILAFVIMPFSPITDALYRWMLKDYIANSLNHMELNDRFMLDQQQLSADDIEVARCDDHISNSHVICESICSKIQEADLIVADLTDDNANVFYELGLAIALGKKILPICYREWYYQHSESDDQENIASFKYKKKYFEYFSINVQEKDVPKNYSKEKTFTEFPYVGENAHIGKNLVDALDQSLRHIDNLLIYDPRRPVQVGEQSLCKIINNFQHIVQKVTRGIGIETTPSSSGMLTRGDRIGFIYLEDGLMNPNKDQNNPPTPYSLGDLARLAINQANYAVESNGSLSMKSLNYERQLGYYLYNCTDTQGINYPLYVDNVKEEEYPELLFLVGLQYILDKEEKREEE